MHENGRNFEGKSSPDPDRDKRDCEFGENASLKTRTGMRGNLNSGKLMAGGGRTGAKTGSRDAARGPILRWRWGHSDRRAKDRFRGYGERIAEGKISKRNIQNNDYIV